MWTTRRVDGVFENWRRRCSCVESVWLGCCVDECASSGVFVVVVVVVVVVCVQQGVCVLCSAVMSVIYSVSTHWENVACPYWRFVCLFCSNVNRNLAWTNKRNSLHDIHTQHEVNVFFDTGDMNAHFL